MGRVIRKIADPQPKDYDGAKALARREVKCHKCGHEWETISDAWMVTCPSCSRKTERIKKEEIKKNESTANN